MSLIIKNGRALIDNHFEFKDIKISEGLISSIEDNIIPLKTDKVIECNGDYVLPGFIDCHTHYGLGSGSDATADDFYSASVLAASSGVTTFIDFSDDLKNGSLIDGAKKRISEARSSGIDFTLHQGFYYMKPTSRKELIELKEFGINTLKIFTTYKQFGVYLDSIFYKELFKFCSELGILVCVHCEDDDIIDNLTNNFHGDFSDYFTHTILRPDLAEEKAISKVLEISKLYKNPIYIVHISSSRGCSIIEKYRKITPVVAETTLHYLLLDNSLLNLNGFKYFMTPPLRTSRDNKLLLYRLNNDFFDIVASDHCSYYESQKISVNDIREIPSGIPGTQELPLVLSGILGDSDEALIKLSRLLSSNPASIFGLINRGNIKIGNSGDFVILKKDKTTFTTNEILSKSKFSAYLDKLVNIKPYCTILRGQIIYHHGKSYVKKGFGRFVTTETSSTFNAEKIY